MGKGMPFLAKKQKHWQLKINVYLCSLTSKHFITMKKVMLIAAFVGVCASAAQAKILAFGVKAGLEMPSIKTDNLVGSAKENNGFHVGFLAQLNAPVIGIGVQPEVLYVRRGVNVDEHGVKGKGVSYLDIPVNLTWGVDLKIVRPFLALTPYLSYALSDVRQVRGTSLVPDIRKIDNFNYGLGLGAGVEVFQKLQVMARYSWGLKNLIDNGSYKTRGYTVSLGYLF